MKLHIFGYHMMSGYPDVMYSDNATNFTNASKQLQPAQSELFES